MTDNEIIKALECCYDLDSTAICHQCPLHQTEECRDGYLGLQAYHLINRQKAEIERLRAKVEKRTQEKLALGGVYMQKLKTAKAEAIKEFAERLKKDFQPNKAYTFGYVMRIIDTPCKRNGR